MAKRTTAKADEQPRYLLVTEEQKDGYYHQYARVVRSEYEGGQRYPWGLSDRYDGPLYSGLRARCQGDQSSRKAEAREQAVYGSDVGYSEQYHVDLREARRMVKMLEAIDRGLAKLAAKRGYARGWGQYLGRLAEVLRCEGIVIDRGQDHEHRSGYRYDWLSVGVGITAADNLIWKWQRNNPARAAAES